MITGTNLLSTSGTTGTSSSTSATAKTDATASQDRFLKLLVAQLNNQDPMNPMDNAQMTSQIAQINTVSGIQQVNETLKGMSDQFASLQVLQGSSMVGRNVLIEGSKLSIQDGKASGAIDLTAQAESVKIEIVSPGGTVLDTINMGALTQGATRSHGTPRNTPAPGRPVSGLWQPQVAKTWPLRPWCKTRSPRSAAKTAPCWFNWPTTPRWATARSSHFSEFHVSDLPHSNHSNISRKPPCHFKQASQD